MAEQKIYHAPGIEIRDLAGVVSDWFENQGFEVQSLEVPRGGMTVQARKPESWRSFLGMSAALNVTMSPQGENLLVQTGAAKWVDKAAVGAVGAIIFWPALIPAAYGAWKQSQLPKQVFEMIDQYIATGQVTAVAPPVTAAPPVASAPLLCPSCGQPVRAGAKFCDNCGAQLELTCPQCGEALRPVAKFCDSCGARVEPAD